MRTHWYAKIFGWGQFLLQLANQVASGQMPHGVTGWIGLVGSLAAAVAIHKAASTDGVK